MTAARSARFGLRSGLLLLAAGTSVGAQARETLLEAGMFASQDVACWQADPQRVVISNDHAVAAPGQSCRVVSRTSIGGYYPAFNQRCTGDGNDVILTGLLVTAPDKIAVRDRATGATTAYRYCPARIEARAGH